MDEFKLLRIEEVIARWDELAERLQPAIEFCNGELTADDLKKQIIAGQVFVFASNSFALTCSFNFYPQKTVMHVGFGAGKVANRKACVDAISAFAKAAGANSIQTHCRNPAMVRYYKMFLDVDPSYTVLEKQI